MSGPLGFSNHSHVGHQAAHANVPIPAGTRVYSSQQIAPAIGKETLIPIQQAFRSLAKEPLFKKGSLNATVTAKDPQSVSWTMAKVGALLGAMYNTHVTTAEDQKKIEALSREVETLKATLKNQEDLTPEEQAYNEKCFSLADEAFQELHRLHRTLKNSHGIETQWEEAIYPLTESVAMPLFPGQSLLMGNAIKQGIKAAAQLQKRIDNLPKDSAARDSLETTRDELAARFIEEYQGWNQGVLKSIQLETQLLLAELDNTQTPERESDRKAILQQLVSLRDQLQKLGDDLLEFTPHKTKGMFALQRLLQKTAYALQQETQSLNQILDQEKDIASLERLKYGKEAWLDLVAKRPVKDPSFLDRLTSMLTFSPETWSESKKALVEKLLVGMQLSQYAIGVQAKMEQASLLHQRAEQMVQTIPTETQEEIERSVGRLGTLLSDKYQDLHRNPRLVDTFAKGDPALRDALLHALGRFGDQKPTRDQLFQVLDAFKLSQYASKQSSPFSHLSLGDWWTLFTKPEEVVEPESPIEQGALAPSLLDNYAVAVSPATRPIPWVSKMIGTVGKALSFTKEADEAPSLSAFVSAQAAEGEQQLNTALTSLAQQQVQVAQDSQHVTQELTREIALLQREVLKTLQNKPEDVCPLSTLAIWEQEVSDKCYAVEQLEERINTLMSQARSSLSADDLELEKFGKKHKNIVKQARLIEGLKLPGLSVPIPHGMTTDQVRAFLEEHAPVVFSEWDTLGKEYAAYQGKTPFFDEPASKTRLQSIEKGIKEAFRQAGEDPVLFQKLASPELIAWLNGVKGNNDYLMVRSTGAEDSRQTANAGGNKSPAYVSPTSQAFCEAAGEVIISYFGFGSLQNRVNAGLNPFEQDLKLAVTAQQLIGEPIGGTSNPKNIPISLVLFTSEPLYIGNEKFRTMRISATLGHGEGVVGGLGIGTDTALLLISEAHPDRLYILYDNADKPVRLAPVQTGHGVELQPVENPSHMQQQPVLNDELLTRLYTWGVVGEKFFDDYPTDMEIVIKNGIIYPVQARPINRPDLLPTYVDRKRIASLNVPILDELQGDLLVPGRGSAVIITDPQQVNIAKTLKEAEDASHKKKYDIVMVAKPEPANSHPVVNFSGLGMPCLVVKDEEHLQKMMSEVSPERPLVIDMQTGSVMLMDQTKRDDDPSKGDINECIVKGFAVHPAKIAISLPVASKVQPKAHGEVPQEVKDLILSIGVAATKQAAQESLQMLRQHPFVTSLTEQRAILGQHQITVRKVKETQKILDSLNERIDQAFEEAAISLQQAPENDRLRPLLRVKILSSLLTEAGGSGLSQFSRLTVQPLYEEALTLIDYQKGLSHPAHFADVVSVGSKALLPETQTIWIDFLKSLEPLAEAGQISKQDMIQFHKMLENLEKTELLPNWLTFTFAPEMAPKGLLSSAYRFFNLEDKPQELLNSFKALLGSLPEKEESFLIHFLSLNQVLSGSQKQIDLFSSPETFEKGWKWLQSQVEQVKSQVNLGSEGSLTEQLRSSSPMSKTLALKVMSQLVDTFDLSIKAMKSSSQWPRKDKPWVFKQMLGPYLDMLLDWTNTLDTAGIPTHESWPIPTYLARMKELFDEMPDNDEAHLDPSREFSVVAAMLGSNTEFSRHYPAHLEDMFTLCHQNLLAILNHNSNQLHQQKSLEAAPLPDLFNHMLTNVDQSFGRRIERSSLEAGETGVVAEYNIPLRNHAAKMKIEYDKQTGETFLKGFLLGQARTRWGISQSILLILDQLGLPLSEPIHMSDQEMSFSWKIKDAKAFTMAKEEWLFLLEMSLRPDFEDQILGRLAARRRMSVESLTNNVISTLQKHTAPQDILTLRLYLALVDNDHSIKEALDVLDLSPETTNPLTLNARFELIGAIVRKQQGVSTAISMASEGLMEEASLELSQQLIETLISQGNEDHIIEVAKKEIKDINPRNRLKSVKLMQRIMVPPVSTLRNSNSPPKEEESIEASLLIAKEGLQDSEESVHLGCLQLLKLAITTAERLNKTEKLRNDPAIKEALAMLNLSPKTTNPLILDARFELIEDIARNKQGEDTAISMVSEGLIEEEALHQQKSYRLLQALIVWGHENRLIEVAKKEIEDINPRNRLKGVKLMQWLLAGLYSRYYSIPKEASEAALLIVKKGLQDSEENIRAASLRLIPYLIREIGLTETLVIAKQQFLETSAIIRKECISLLETIVRYGMGIKEALSTANAENMALDPDRMLNLMQALIEKEQGFSEAIVIAQLGMKDPSPEIRAKSMKLLATVVNKGHGIPEGIAIAEAGSQDPSPDVREATIGLFVELIKQNQNPEAALAAVGDHIDNPTKAIFELLTLLAEKKLGLDLGVAAAKRGTTDLEAQSQVLDLLQVITKETQDVQILEDVSKVVSEIFPIVLRFNLRNANERLRRSMKCLGLIEVIVNRGIGLKAASVVANTGLLEITEEDRRIRTRSIEVMEAIVNQGGDLDNAINFAKTGIRDPEHFVRHKTIQLIEMILHKSNRPAIEIIHEIAAYTTHSFNRVDHPDRMQGTIELITRNIKPEETLSEEMAATCITAVVKGIDASTTEGKQSAAALFNILVKRGYGSAVFKEDPIAYAKLQWYSPWL